MNPAGFEKHLQIIEVKISKATKYYIRIQTKNVNKTIQGVEFYRTLSYSQSTDHFKRQFWPKHILLHMSINYSSQWRNDDKQCSISYKFIVIRRLNLN